MAIVKISKFTLFAFESQKEALLDNFHKFENIQFVNLQESEEEDLLSLQKDSENEKVSYLEGEQAKVKFALDLLMKHSEKEGAIKTLVKGKSSMNYEQLETLAKKSNYKENYQKLKQRDNDLIQMKSEKSKVNSEIELLTPWIPLDVSFKDLRELNSSIFIMGSLPKAFKDAFRENFEGEIPCSYLEVISESAKAINIITVVYKEYEDKAREVLKNYSFNAINLKYDGISVGIVGDFKKRLGEILKEEEKINIDIKNDCKYLEDFKIVYEYLSNKHIKASACKNFLKTQNIIAIEGWVPTESSKDLEELIKSTAKEEFYLEIEGASKEDDKVPILLKNNAVIEPFEIIVSMYSLPKYSEIDPTPVMAPFYMVFFGMMLADLGYGLVMFTACMLALKKFNLDEGQKKFARFFLLLSIPTALAGIAYGSFFGDIIPYISTHSIINPGEDILLLLIIAIVLGTIQIYFGLGVKGYMLIREGKPMDAVYDVLTWYAALTGAFLLLGGSQIGLSPSVINIGKWVMILGMVSLVLTQGRQNKSIGAKLGGGLYGLYGISSYIGDLVSYSRIMALGLAGGFIASAFNMLIKMIPTPFNIIFGIFIFVFAQTFNLLLSALSAFVHSARLQYVEYFSKFYEGGGKAFRVFKSKNQYINVTKGKQI